jgi:hypothetical protein
MVQTLKAQTIDLRYLIEHFSSPYRLADPNPETPTFSMITNGVNFRLVKLVREKTPKYALSDEFVIDNRGNKLYSVLKILKHLSQLAG